MRKYYSSIFLTILVLTNLLLTSSVQGDSIQSQTNENFAFRPLADSVTGSTNKDTYAESAYPNTSPGNQFNLYVGWDTLNGQYNKGKTRIYIKFNLPTLPTGAIIDTVKVELYQYAKSATSSYGVTVYPLQCDWAEYELNWKNKPTCLGSAAGSLTISTSNGWKSIDITNLGHQWYSNPSSNYGITIQANNESANGGVFYSKDCYSQCSNGAYRPRLQVTYHVDTTAPTGNLTAPTEGAKIGPGQVSITAEASDNAGGVGVQSVKFKVVYDGQWRDIGTDTTAPYGVNWTTPAGLRSQQIRFAIDVTDNAGNVTLDAGGHRTVNFIESQGNPSVIENWVPKSKRAYLNQRSLSPSGDSKCGSASAAMMLAMNGLIGKDYNSLRDTANAIYPKTIKDGQILLYLITAQMRARGLNAGEKNKSASDAWKTIKSEINAGRPVMVLSRKVTAGHFFVIVGYREEGSSRKIIVYDPYGRWLGSYQRYDRNSTSADSTKGKWVTYDYNASWGGGWIVTGRPYAQAMAADEASVLLDDNDPDPISEEPLEEVIYEGELIDASQFIFLPLVMREN